MEIIECQPGTAVKNATIDPWQESMTFGPAIPVQRSKRSVVEL
jgi:hypothetical protein